ncbi:LANO_0B05182g1_1 [Lachancea nothofagi CBS 11611]|uniref:LANO_0B05182g1_1 n=1 Tax=Lachancea nothofagi CBS 11611 TaxID=1266666 RepID=A0A1G4IY58_9SACH|nr:LANO_0B05182g1_1 [Lachancea nothofagi CBS 11611]
MKANKSNMAGDPHGSCDSAVLTRNTSPELPEYDGLDCSARASVRELARTFTNGSVASNSKAAAVGVHATTALPASRTTTEYGDVNTTNPVFSSSELPSYNSRLDPNSDEFSSALWVKNLSQLIASDPDHYKPYSLGCTWKNLRAYGNATDVAYQSTFANLPLQLLESGYRAARKARPEDSFDILKPMDGIVKPSELLVVLGRPGSGCSTLLKSISANTHGFHIDSDSEIFYDGMDPKEIAKHYRGEVVYNAESDVHFPHLTVFDTLKTVARLSCPSNRFHGVDRETFATHITEVAMATYGLSHTRNTKVGSELVRGVSGGERKRVSIAEVSICGSKFQCWDNATRGLDSATALEFIRALRTTAKLNNSAGVIAIYQCSQDAYDLFDKVCVLHEGYQIYFGPANEAKQYFLDMGYVSPDRQTTADFLTAVTNPAERIVNQEMVQAGKVVPSSASEMEAHWKQSENYKRLINEIDHYTTHDQTGNREQLRNAHIAKQSKRARHSSSYTVSYGLQVKYLLIRNMQRIRSSMGVTLFQVIGNGGMAFILGSMFYKILKHDTTAGFYSRAGALFFAVLFNAFSCLLEILALYEARPISEKHKRYSLYHPSADALASVISEIPSKLVTSVVFNLALYFLCNFKREAGAFFFYFLMTIVATFLMSHIFRCLGAATKTYAESMVSASLLLLAQAIYTGFAIPKTNILGWSKWIWYINPLSYIFESLMVNEFHGRNFSCSQYIPAGSGYEILSGTERVCSAVGAVPGQDFVSGETYINVAYGYYHAHKWRGLGIGLAYAIVFLAVYLAVTEFNESAKQRGEILVFPQSVMRRMKKERKLRNSSDYSGTDVENSAGSAPLNEKKMLDESSVSAGSTSSMGDAKLSKSEAIYHWRNVCFEVNIKKETRRILNNVDGWVKPGTLTALMGASGAGKTTLLDCLASRVTTGTITGDMFINGFLRDASFARSIGYCQQQDLHLESATVRESLRFAAYLRQPATVSEDEKNKYVEDVIKILEMETYANAVVGVAGEGLNVEQRKRLTIGVELAAKPKLLLFLDEPTSGLDSQTAWSICQLMRKLANHGQAILCTIHQPSALLMQEFDRLLFLQRGGQTVYFGELGKGCHKMIDYFESNGAPRCPDGANPAEWMLAVIGAAPGTHANQDYHEVWRNSPEYRAVQEELEWMEQELPKKPIDTSNEQTEFAASLLYQYYLVTKRLAEQYWRTPSYLWSKLILSVISQIFIGFTFFKADSSLQGLQNQMLSIFMFTLVFNPTLQQYLPTFVSQRGLYEARERPSKTFSWVSFMLSQITVEIPWNILAGTIGFIIYYYPVGFYNNASKAGQLHERGALFWLYCTAFYVFTGSMAQVCIAGLDVAEAAGELGSLLYTLALSFCGVMVTPSNMPRFWLFMYRVSPITYFIDGVLSTGVANADVHCADYEMVRFTPPAGQTCGQYMSRYIETTGTGYLDDPSAMDECKFCSVSDTNEFLKAVTSSYDHRWRNYGIFLVFIFVNFALASFLYWLMRVPKKRNRVVDERKPEAQKLASK